MTIKPLPANLFNEPENYKFTRRFAILPSTTKFEDLFHPTFWAHYANKWAKYDIVRVVAEDDSFDVDLMVANVAVGGITMKVRPYFGDRSGEAAVEAAAKAADEGRLTVVSKDKAGKLKVYVEHLPATNWRVVGLNGEVSRDHKTKGEAEKAMKQYLKANGLTMPVDEKDAA